MNLRRALSLVLAVVLCMICISGCSDKKPDETKAAVVEATVSSTVDPMPTSSTLVETVILSLPENITKEFVSDTRAYFRADGEVIGGIEILNVAGQRDAMLSEDEYEDLAFTVTKLVQDGEYDCSVDTMSGLADVNVGIKFQDGRTFAHYYDHTFPLRSKAPKGMKPKYLRRNLSKFVRLYLRKQAHYRARGGE